MGKPEIINLRMVNKKKSSWFVVMNNAKLMVISRSGLETISVNFKL
jgi:hypothetical protein